jgi:hypothetical protein
MSCMLDLHFSHGWGVRIAEFSQPNNRSVVARPPTVIVHPRDNEPVSSPRQKRPITGKPQDRPDRAYYDEPDIV